MSSIIYELAVVEDHGTYWKVVNVVKNTLDNLASREEKMLKLSYVAYQLVKNAILENKLVTIAKTLTTDEVLPHELNIVDLNATDHLQETKNACITKIRMLVTPELSRVTGFAFYGFTILNNDLINAGYVITNSNREEKYLEILETGDPALIEKLETYLNYKDELEAISNVERKFSKYVQEVKRSGDVDEVLALTSNFLEGFYSNR